MAPAETAPTGNMLLDALPGDERARLRELMEPVDLERGAIVYDQGEDVAFVLFPVSGIVSLVTITLSGAMIELATTGREGMVGVPLALEAERWDNGRAMVQISGEALRMPADVFTKQLGSSEVLRRMVFRYVQALLVQIGQAVACNRLHAIEQRAGRWLLQTHDRVGDDELRLTHEFLAAMLGVRRASVSVAAGDLRKRGLVDYSRGLVRILDRPGLEEISCECYAAVRREFERLLPPLDIPT